MFADRLLQVEIFVGVLTSKYSMTKSSLKWNPHMYDHSCSLCFLYMVSSFQARSTEKRWWREAGSWKTLVSADCSQSLNQTPSLSAVVHSLIANVQ